MLMDGYKLDQGIHSDMAAATAKKTKPAKDQAAIDTADLFVRSARERKAAEKSYADAKAELIAFLDGAPSKVLSDGRTVTASMTDFPAAVIDRKAYTATNVVVSPSPAA